jgi:hypothetical protein
VRRLIRYRLVVPVFRSPHSPEYTARGVANGVLWGLTPFMGLQTILILSTWIAGRRVFRRDSSVLQALIWVWVNNPITMLPMYYVFYLTGLWLSGTSGSFTGYAEFVLLWDTSAQEPRVIDRLIFLGAAIGLPIAIGCIPYSLLGSGLAYRWTLRVLRARRVLTRPRGFAPR